MGVLLIICHFDDKTKMLAGVVWAQWLQLYEHGKYVYIAKYARIRGSGEAKGGTLVKNVK